jgi:hypothetical protein
MPEKKRRKKKTDKAWHPRQNAAPRDFAGFTTESLLRLMRTASSPAKKVVILKSTKKELAICEGEKVLFTPTKKHSSQLLSPSGYRLSTPEAGPKTSHLITNTGSKLLPSRVIECDDGDISVFLSENKVPFKELKIPLQPKPWIQNSPVPEVDMQGMIDIPITKKQIKQVETLIRNRKKAGEDPRGISQNKLNKIPATKAMRKAGIEIEDGDGHYAHFIPFSFLGDDAQKVQNMGIGTRFANAAMELVNPAIRRLLYKKNGPKVVYLSAIPEWVPGFEKIRLLKSITYVIKDGIGDDFKHSAKVAFNMLSLAEVCVTDVRPIRDSIIAKFSDERLKENKEPTVLISPTKTMPMSPSLHNPAMAISSLRNRAMATSPSLRNRAMTRIVPPDFPISPSPLPIVPAFRKKLSDRSPLVQNQETEANTFNPVRKLNYNF